MGNKQDWSFAGAWPWGAFAFGPQGRSFGPGEVRLAILSLLLEAPKHGYQLIKEIQERSGGLYHVSAGTVYPTLQQLEDEGLIESEQQERRRFYHLTEAGRRELASDPEAVRRIWERAERYGDWRQHMGPESIMLVGPLADLTKSAFRAAGRIGVDRVREVLDRARKELDAF